ncbi:MAG: nicotinate-nicotinamide nucleotide adenylyltransferase [Parcubacteria group bacterium]|nr:nicotinate-nicotinamide nucleotide adenylyltransferase [Parcubacteria group bacterium]
MVLHKKKKIIIYSGAFNPPHIGHATVIEAAMRLFPCDELWVMPTANRRDKKIKVSGKHRLAMLKSMNRSLFSLFPKPIRILPLEINRPRLTATYETKIELERMYPHFAFYFLIGSDIAGDIKTKWVNGKKLFKTAQFIIFKRHAFSLPKNIPPHSFILDKNIQSLDFSSTFIRNILQKGHSGVPYITPEVAAYIKKHKLYV